MIIDPFCPGYSPLAVYVLASLAVYALSILAW